MKVIKKIIIYLVTTIVLLVIAVFTWLYVKQSSKSPNRPSTPATGSWWPSTDKEDEYLADGLLDGVIGDLGKVDELIVFSKTTANQFIESNQSPIEIAKELRVNYVLEGNIQKQ